MITKVPNLLNLPEKLMPMVTDFAKFKYFVIEGGRGSAKTQSVARLLLTIGDQRKIRVFCGREIQSTIDESVHAVLADLIINNELAYKVQKKQINHYYSGAEFNFKGFREQGAVNIKGVEGADIIWIDEAQTVTKATLDMLIPTVRKNTSKIIFTMNRHMRDDAVITELVGRPDCLHIKINYFENRYCPLTLKHEAEIQRSKSEKDYRHIWLGEPLATAGDYLFNYDKLWAALENKPFGDIFKRQRVLGIDYAAQGDDNCVATLLERMSNQHWTIAERVSWGESDTTISTGKIAGLIGKYKPDVTILDVANGGHNVHCELTNAGLVVHRFDGGSTLGVQTQIYVNQRAEGYYTTKEWFEHGYLCLGKNDTGMIKEFEKVKMKWRSDGKRLMEEKVKMKKELGFSPDEADSCMMAIYGAVKYLGKPNSNPDHNATDIPRRKSVSKRRRG